MDWDILLLQETFDYPTGTTFTNNAGHRFYQGIHHWRGGMVVATEGIQVLRAHTNLRHPVVCVLVVNSRVLLSFLYLPHSDHELAHYMEIINDHMAATMFALADSTSSCWEAISIPRSETWKFVQMLSGPTPLGLRACVRSSS